MLLYPRLKPEAALEIATQIQGKSLEHLRATAGLSHDQTEFYPSGIRVNEKRLAELQSSVRAVVDSLGFPKAGSVRARTTFDQKTAGLIYKTMDIVPADAASSDVWSFITLVVLPDAAIWRYPDGDLRRLIGDRERNVLERLWWRAFVLGDGPAEAPAILGEDQLVQVMERASLGGNPRVARALCEAYLRQQGTQKGVPAMLWMRDATKRLIRLTAFMDLDAIADRELQALMDDIVMQAARSLGR